MGNDYQAIKKLFNRDLIRFLEDQEIQQMESNGEALLIFKYLHIAPADEVPNMLKLSDALLDHMNLQKVES